jgi:glycosyltransferase involved in cell wall biosynthesis
MSAPRVSIVTTVYDRVDCLARCLRATTHLRFTDVEQIVVADAPPPDVRAAIADVVAATQDARVRLLARETRANDWGMTPAHDGLLASRGDYVCFLSDDNAYLPDHFRPLVAALDADPTLAFVYSSCQYAGRTVLNYAPPCGARIDLGQPLFRRQRLVDLFPRGFGFSQFAWDWRLIEALLKTKARWRHVDAQTFIFRLAAYPALVEALR